MLQEKIASLSPALQKKIFTGERQYVPSKDTPVSNFLVNTKRHCNGGNTVTAGLWLRDHCDNGGKIFVTMSGAGSSFQQGIMLSELIKKGLVTAISVTGANLEESLYRLVANSHYAYIPDYTELTRTEEKELAQKGFRRITDTFLPEEESVRMLLPHFETLWREAQKENKQYFWHEYFFMLFERNLITPDPTTSFDDCWLYQAYKHNVALFVPGIEDQTMGNIFTYFCYNGTHPTLSKYAQEEPINPKIIKHGFDYMHSLAEWYLDNTKEKGIAFLQLGGGIAADFPICVVPHIKKDFMDGYTEEEQEAIVRSWVGFVEIHSSPMSFGSYSGAGFKEKITWEKFDTTAFGIQIFGDYTEHFPDIYALILRK